MRFRTFGNMPSFFGYVSGHSLWKSIAYGVASDMGRDWTQQARVHAYAQKYELKVAVLHEVMKWRDEHPELRAVKLLRERRAPRCVDPATLWRPAATKSNGGLRGSTASRWG